MPWAYEARHWHKHCLYPTGPWEVGWLVLSGCVCHVAHSLDWLIEHRGAAYLCSWCEWHDQNLGFRVQGPGFGHQLFSCCVALAAISGCISSAEAGSTRLTHVTGLFQGTTLDVMMSPTGAQGLSLPLLLRVGRLFQQHCLWRFSGFTDFVNFRTL